MNELEILQLIEEKKYKRLKKVLSDMNEVDIADILNDLDSNTTLLIFRMLPKDLAVDVFAHFSTEQQEDIINAVTDKELNYILDELFFDDMIDMIEEMPSNVVSKILINSTQEERNLINQFLKYPEDSAGSIMTIEYVELKPTMNVKEALAHLKEIGLNKETIYTCYVTDTQRKLEGIVSLRKLVISNDDAKITDLMDTEAVYVYTHDDQESVANVFVKYGFLALPVVDNENRLTGIITVDDIMDVIEQEATEDFQIMAAMVPSETAYMNTKVTSLAKQRIPWLLVLMLSATFTGRIINKFNDVLQAVVILASFIPMLMDTGGNSGSQSSTLIIRGLATGEINVKDAGKIFWKEIRIGIIVGLTLAAVNFARLMLIEKVDPTVALTVSLTLVVTVMIAKMVGGTLPLLAKKLKVDPALMAGPLITTLVDAISLMVYFSVASALLGL
ncbi:MAG: magnesium transporter [Tissierellia bacterium]|nr:magnesium transporter [Tissierellia bacterium]MDD4725358.1 magnesium transporter [Tissierellia bacterium]